MGVHKGRVAQPPQLCKHIAGIRHTSMPGTALIAEVGVAGEQHVAARLFDPPSLLIAGMHSHMLS